MTPRIISALVVTVAALAAAVVLTITNHDATPAWALLAVSGGAAGGIAIPADTTKP